MTKLEKEKTLLWLKLKEIHPCQIDGVDVPLRELAEFVRQSCVDHTSEFEVVCMECYTGKPLNKKIEP